MFLSNHPFTNLAGLGFWQRVAELDQFRHHEIFKPRRAMTKHVLLGKLGSRAQGQDGFYGVTEDRVRDSDYRHLRHTFK